MALDVYKNHHQHLMKYMEVRKILTLITHGVKYYISCNFEKLVLLKELIFIPEKDDILNYTNN